MLISCLVLLSLQFKKLGLEGLGNLPKVSRLVSGCVWIQI